MLDSADDIHELLAFGSLIVSDMHGLAEFDAAVRGTLDVQARATRPGATVVDVTGEALLPAIEIDRGNALAVCIKATAICMAVVDFPDPPFSLPSTTTYAESDRFACINIVCLSRTRHGLQNSDVTECCRVTRA
jgi:hypothetical protein